MSYLLTRHTQFQFRVLLRRYEIALNDIWHIRPKNLIHPGTLGVIHCGSAPTKADKPNKGNSPKAPQSWIQKTSKKFKAILHGWPYH